MVTAVVRSPLTVNAGGEVAWMVNAGGEGRRWYEVLFANGAVTLIEEEETTQTDRVKVVSHGTNKEIGDLLFKGRVSSLINLFSKKTWWAITQVRDPVSYKTGLLFYYFILYGK